MEVWRQDKGLWRAWFSPKDERWYASNKLDTVGTTTGALRTGVLGMGLSLVVPTWLETLLYLFLMFWSEKGKGIFFVLFASIGAASAIMSHALWQVCE